MTLVHFTLNASPIRPWESKWENDEGAKYMVGTTDPAPPEGGGAAAAANGVEVVEEGSVGAAAEGAAEGKRPTSPPEFILRRGKE